MHRQNHTIKHSITKYYLVPTFLTGAIFLLGYTEEGLCVPFNEREQLTCLVNTAYCFVDYCVGDYCLESLTPVQCKAVPENGKNDFDCRIHIH